MGTYCLRVLLKHSLIALDRPSSTLELLIPPHTSEVEMRSACIKFTQSNERWLGYIHYQYSMQMLSLLSGTTEQEVQLVIVNEIGCVPTRGAATESRHAHSRTEIPLGLLD